MSIIEITDVNEALALLTRAVNEKGHDYTDPNYAGACAYFDQSGTPGCIIGHVLSYKGLTLADTDATEREDIYSDSWNTGHGVGEIPDDLVTLSGEVRSIFEVAQERQDTGHTWGEALAEAELVAASFAA